MPNFWPSKSKRIKSLELFYTYQVGAEAKLIHPWTQETQLFKWGQFMWFLKDFNYIVPDKEENARIRTEDSKKLVLNTVSSQPTWGCVCFFFFFSWKSFLSFLYLPYREIHIECSKQLKWNLYLYVVCLGRAGHFGQCKKCFEIEIWNLNRLTHIQFNVWGRV